MLMRLHCWPPRPGNGARSKIARGINYYCYGWRMCGGTMCNRCMNTTRHSTIKPRAIVYGLSEYIYSFRHYYYNNKWVMENRIVHILYVAWMVGVATIILREVNMRGRDIRYLTHSLKRVYICNICINIYICNTSDRNVLVRRHLRDALSPSTTRLIRLRAHTLNPIHFVVPCLPTILTATCCAVCAHSMKHVCLYIHL